MEAIKVLEDVLADTNKKNISKNKQKAVEALMSIYTDTNDPKQVAEYLIKLHCSVCQAFLEEFCLSASDENVTSIVEALVNDEQFKKGNPNNIMYPKGLSAVLALAAKGKYQVSFFVLNRILTQAEKSENFSEGLVNNFRRIEKNGSPFISNLIEKVTSGVIVSNEFEQKRFARFLKAIDEKTVAVSGEGELVITQNSESSQQSMSEISQDFQHACRCPFASALFLDSRFCHFSGNALNARPIEVKPEDRPNNCCFVGVHGYYAFLYGISVHEVQIRQLSVFEPVVNPPLAVIADRAAFLLRDSRKKGENHLTLSAVRMNPLFVKENVYA